MPAAADAVLISIAPLPATSLLKSPRRRSFMPPIDVEKDQGPPQLAAPFISEFGHIAAQCQSGVMSAAGGRRYTDAGREVRV